MAHGAVLIAAGFAWARAEAEGKVRPQGVKKSAQNGQSYSIDQPREHSPRSTASPKATSRWRTPWSATIAPAPTEAFLAQAESEIRGYGKLVVNGIVEIGRKLVEVKERVGHGRYTAFVTERLGWSMRSGQNFVAVFEMVKSANFAPLDDLTIDASSLYRIAAPSTPAEVREAVLEKAADLVPAAVMADEPAAGE
jgi:hypothetical protein